MELGQLFIGDIYKLTNIDELTNHYQAIKVKETIIYRRGYIETKYIDLKTRKIYTGDYSNLNIGDEFINEYTLKPYSEILKENELEEDQSLKNILVKYKKYKDSDKN